MGGQTQQPTQTTTTSLSPQAQQLFNLAMPGVQNFAASVPQKYPGPTVAGFTPAQTQAQDMALNAATGGQAQAAQTAGDVFNQLPGQINTPIPGLTPFVGQNQTYESNPFAGMPQAGPALDSYIAAAQRPIYQNLTEQVLPNIRGGAVTAGGFGGSRQGIAEGVAAGKAGQTAADTAANIAGQQYATNVNALQQRYGTNINAEQARYATNVGAEQNRLQLMEAAKQGDTTALLQLLGQTPTVQGAQLAPALTAAGVGSQQQEQNQADINAQIQAWNYQQLAPFLQSQEIASLAQGLPGGTTTSTANVPQPNPIIQGLGTGVTGAALGSALFPGAGTALGAVGGATLPFLFR